MSLDYVLQNAQQAVHRRRDHLTSHQRWAPWVDRPQGHLEVRQVRHLAVRFQGLMVEAANRQRWS
ncbi:hypothetical protein A5730_03055 [Mycobacterium sp. ACS4054]|nr:hypothetical protein A5730_03055 [Mycobacterium sp. ACS4054]